ncbi:PmoA family protein, partial [bacterium]|nr:PmoA family protein [bacterium]
GDKLDHHHHRSVWIAHGEVNGVNNWAENPGHGRTKHTGFDALESGPILGRIVAKGDWVGPEGWACPTRANKLLEETAEWTFYKASTLTFDLRLTLKAMDMDVLFADTKEGGLASVRVEESMEVRKGGRIENAYGGVGEKETWGKPAHWCDYSGPVNGRIVGVTIMDAPDSFRHPTRWHVRDYGLMTANPFGLSHYTGDIKQRSYHVLPAGETLRASYRFYVHAGDAAEGRVREKYHDFANPPVAQIQ